MQDVWLISFNKQFLRVFMADDNEYAVKNPSLKKNIDYL